MSVPTARLFDVGLALAVTGAGVAEIWVPFSSRAGEGSAAASTVATVLAGLALIERRRHPLAAGLAALACWPVAFAVAPVYILFYGALVPMAIAVFSMARHGRGRVPIYGAAAGAVVLLFMDLFVDALQSPGEFVFHWSVFAIVWGFGSGLRRHEHQAEQSTRRAIEIEVRATQDALSAVLAERSRIARELHDIVAHSVSVMVVQAGAAEQVVGEDHEFVRRALGTIRRTGGDALAEMRRVVEMLRDEDEPGSLSPQPGVGSVPDLVAGARSAGLDVRLDVSGDPVPLAAGVDLAAYRIIQEALTNARRHASASIVEIRLGFGADGLDIVVSDDGIGSSEPTATGGHGLAGMRERVSLYGGRLDASGTAGRGFVVHAVLPIGGSA